MKTCTVCKIDKNISCFGVEKRTKSGFQASCKECNNLRGKERYLKIKEYAKKQAIEYRNKNYQKRIEIERKSRLKNKEKYRMLRSERQSYRNYAINSRRFLILPKELKKIYNSGCFKCGSNENQSLDHIVPISRGGNHSVGNIMTLCKNCNASKGNKYLVQWLYKKEVINNGTHGRNKCR